MSCHRSLWVHFAVLLLSATLAAAEVTAFDEFKTDLPSASFSGDAWLRCVFQVGTDPMENVDLAVASHSTVTVYLNGQRLTRNHSASDSWLVWDITELLRKGKNCLAVSAGGATTAGSINVRISAASHAKVSAGAWTHTSVPPPVGWQQTDFNDRDWAKLAGSNANAPDDLKVQRLQWKEHSVQPRWQQDRLVLRDNDHVVMLGGTFIERAQNFGHLESQLAANCRATGVTFRNLGWSADTVFAESRGIFDSPEKGYERMIEHVRAEEPDVVLVCYGQNEAMTTEDTNVAVARFETQLAKLHADLKAGGSEVILVSPHPLLTTAPPLPNPASWNARIAVFVKAISQFAADNNIGFVDLFANFEPQMEANHARLHFSPMPDNLDDHADLQTSRTRLWSDNGMHWNNDGYKVVSGLLVKRLLGKQPEVPAIEVHLADQTVTSSSGTVTNVAWNPSPDALVSFDYCPNVVTPHPLLLNVRPGLAVEGLKVATSQSADPQDRFVQVQSPAQNDSDVLRFVKSSAVAYEALRELTIAKNELYFHRWRPQNITYLFGFRKHEQGNNASEIARFDPLIDQLEARIHTAQRPKSQTLTVIKVD